MKHSGYQFDVYFLTKPHPPQNGDCYEVICSFEAGYAAFIHPLFAGVNDEAGRDIVLIDWAHFGGNDLKLLANVISTVRQRMIVKEEIWDVFCGHSTNKEETGTRRRDKNSKYSQVSKHKMNRLIDKVDAAIAGAKSEGAYVSFNFWGGGG